MEKNVAMTLPPTGIRRVLTQILILATMLSACSAIADDAIGVVYPEVREPFSRIYTDILSGIEAKYQGSVIQFPIQGDLNSTGIARGSGPDLFIALGSKGLNAIRDQNKLIVAAVTRKPAQDSVAAALIMKPSAVSYLQALTAIYPDVTRVHTVFDNKRHGQLMSEARDYLSQKNVRFDPVGVNDVRECAQAFREIVQGAEDGDAIWLITDGGLVDASVLSFILDAAWEKRLAVFSSNPEFVKRGALFAIYPDNVNLGKRLAEMSMEIRDGRRPKGTIEYLNDVHIAYNERTGNHIGLKLTKKAKSEIDLMLPKY